MGNIETHAWSECREQVSVELSATDEASVSPSPPTQGSENIMKEKAKIAKARGWDDLSKTRSSGHDRTSELLNS